MLQKVIMVCQQKFDAAQDVLKWFPDVRGQTIAKCHSFSNMYDMLQAIVDRLAGKTYLVQKNIKNSVFLRTKMGITSIWEDLPNSPF